MNIRIGDVVDVEGVRGEWVVVSVHLGGLVGLRPVDAVRAGTEPGKDHIAMSRDKIFATGEHVAYDVGGGPLPWPVKKRDARKRVGR